MFVYLLMIFCPFALISLQETSQVQNIEKQNYFLDSYLLPKHHPIKKKLDRLFARYRVTESAESFEKAGFGKARIRKPTNIIVGKHPAFKGYIFKVYLDSQPPLNEWECFIKRIEGAKAIAACIKKHQFKHFMVPKKWLYQLPLTPFSNGPHPKSFILIVEDAVILNQKANLRAFKTEMTQEILEELYTIIYEEQLIDSVYPDNIPFTYQKKIAFVDTEHFHCEQRIAFEKLNRYLSSEMQKTWQEITNATN